MKAIHFSLAVVLMLSLPCFAYGQPCGDADNNGMVNVSDALYLMQYIFSGGPAPADPGIADFDKHLGLTVGDVNVLVGSFLSCDPFPECPPPFPPLEPQLNADYRILYYDTWPAHSSGVPMLLTLVSPESYLDVWSMSLPLRIRVDGLIPNVDSIQFPLEGSAYEPALSHCSFDADSGYVLLGAQVLAAWDESNVDRFAKVYLRLPPVATERQIEVEWVTLSPAQAPIPDSTIVPMVVGYCEGFVREPVLEANCCVQAGDADLDGITNVSDCVYIIYTIFGGGPGFPCEPQADADGSGIANISDVVYLLAFIFAGGRVPVCGPA